MRQLHHVPLAIQCIYECSDGDEDGDGKEGREWRLPGLLYANDLVPCCESKEDLRPMVRWFAEVRRRRDLKVNAIKRKDMVMNREEGL